MLFKKRQSSGNKPARVRLHFAGAAGTVTGSFYLLEIREGSNPTWIAVDCGRYLEREKESLNYNRPLPIGCEASKIKCVIFTHTHDDHIGCYGKLHSDGFHGKAYITNAGKAMMELQIMDSARIQESRANTSHPRVKPLCTEQIARSAMKLVNGVDFRTRFSPVKGVNVEFLPASHLLGAAMIRIEIATSDGPLSILFTGDLGRPGMPLLQDVARVDYADYIVCEGTNGGIIHPAGDPRDAITGVMNRAFGRATVPHRKHGFGHIIVAGYAGGKMQNFLVHLNEAMRSGCLPHIPVKVDTPLGIGINDVYRKHRHLYPDADRKRYRTMDPFAAPDYEEILSHAQSVALDDLAARQPTIIISSSGNADFGRVVHHLEHRLSGPQNTVVFLGHQPQGSRGANLTANQPDSIEINGKDVKVRATIELIRHLSGHRDADEILDAPLSKLKRPPKKLFITHAEPASAVALMHRIKKRFPSINVAIPTLMERCDLN